MEDKKEQATSTENNIVSLKEAISTAQKFINGEMTEDQLSVWGIKISVKPYIPSMDKLRIMLQLTQDSEYSNTETQEIKVIEFYKNMFFDGLLEYTNIDTSDDKLKTFINYDLLYPILSDFILQYCRKDYELLVSMVKDTINFYNIKETNEALKNIDMNVINDNTKSNTKLIKNLADNKEIIKDLKDIMEFNDPVTQRIVNTIKEQALNNSNERAKEIKESSEKKKRGRPKKVIDLEEVKNKKH